MNTLSTHPAPIFLQVHRVGSAAPVAALLFLLVSCATPPPPEPPKPVVAAVVQVPEPVRKPGPPVAPVRNVSETFFGSTVVDPYRYLEDVKNPDVIAYMKAQGEFARKTLDAIPGRVAMLERINTLSEAGVSITGVQIAGTGNRCLEIVGSGTVHSHIA